MTETGFVSAVRHSENPDVLVVRARDEESLRGLSEASERPITVSPEADYGFRILIAKDMFAVWVLEMVSNLDYTNYKSRMWSERPEFGAALHDVWVAMHQVTPNRVTEADRQRAKELYPNQEWTDHEIEMAKALGHL
jgi:hypothetical protein